MHDRTAIAAEIGDHSVDQRLVVGVVEPAQVRIALSPNRVSGERPGEHDMPAPAERLRLELQAFGERIHGRLRAVGTDERQGLSVAVEVT